jgi:hypothetical protein
MNTKATAKLAMVGCVLLAASTVLATETFKKLSGSEIRAQLAGMELTNEVHWREAALSAMRRNDCPRWAGICSEA